ncbi:hypothetical protein [Nonomuraea typhae]|uniref:hypothetical protein n=1 Tax=Nonomuraea typhae TaxID=2603600 RepID=UPI0012F77D96|nr:hypothetical protein [Nonomuraea typhae]
MTAHNYPLRLDGDDPRFNFGLLYDMSLLLESAGYPRLTGDDVVSLRQALYGFLYGPRT